MAEQPEPDVRFSLANERTLLAYQRTAMGLVAGAIAVAKFFQDDVLAVLLAVALLVTGLVAALGGYVHFRRVDEAVRSGRPIGSGPAAHTLSVAMLVCLALAAAVVARGG